HRGDGFFPARKFHNRLARRRRSAELHSAVSQVCNQTTARHVRTPCRLQVGETAECNSALRASRPQLGQTPENCPGCWPDSIARVADPQPSLISRAGSSFRATLTFPSREKANALSR